MVQEKNHKTNTDLILSAASSQGPGYRGLAPPATA